MVDAQVNSGFFYSSADQREKLVAAERAVVDARVQKIIDLKHQVGSRALALADWPRSSSPTLCSRSVQLKPVMLAATCVKQEASVREGCVSRGGAMCRCARWARALW